MALSGSHPTSTELLRLLWEELGSKAEDLPEVTFVGEGAFRSKFALTDLAAAAHAACGAALSELVGEVTNERAAVMVDRYLASASFELPPRTFQPVNGPPHPHGPTPWMRSFLTADDRWMWVQAFFARPRARLVAELEVADDPDAVAAEIRKHPAEELEQRLADAGAVVAVSRTGAEWRAHPQGEAAAAEPLVDQRSTTPDFGSRWRPTPGRPLSGLRVLDLTRVVAGPTGTRLLAAAGAEVLRIDAPDSEESTAMVGAGADHNAGKRWALLDLRISEGRARFLELLAEADVLAHSYRPGALDGLVSPELRAAARPGLVEVTLNAYGWTGPWRTRRGFDTIVQYSTGIADETTAWALADPERRTPLNSLGHEVPADRPRHLPVEALDFVTGYLLAAATVRGLSMRLRDGYGSVSRLSLARTAALVTATRADPDEPPLSPPLEIAYEEQPYATTRGPARRMPFAVRIERNPLFWERPAERAGSSTPTWSTP